MEQGRVPYKKILFVCVNRREPHETCCAQRESEVIAAALKERVKALGLSRSIRVSKSGCQDLCAKGPNVMLFPDYAWYHGVTPADVERILQETVRVLNGEKAGRPSLRSGCPAGGSVKAGQTP